MIHATTQGLSCSRQLTSSGCPMSHTSASWAWPLELKGPHLTVILLFTCVHGLQASRSQEKEGQAPALRRRQASKPSLLITGKTTYWGFPDPEGREPQKPGLLFDHSSNLPEPGRRHCGQRTPPTENSETHTVDWTRPQTGVAIGKANAMFSERPARLFHLLWWACARGHDRGTAGTSPRALKDGAPKPVPL